MFFLLSVKQKIKSEGGEKENTHQLEIRNVDDVHCFD